MTTGLTGIGYEGLSIDDLIARLRLDGVAVVADVRLTPISRKSGFSKRALTAHLASAGIRYLHFPSLGNPRDNRPGYADPESIEGHAARDRYRRMLEGSHQRTAVEELVELSSEFPVAVLCFEADERRCHREQVIAAVHDLAPE